MSDVEVGGGASNPRGSAKLLPLERRCPDCDKPMERHNGEWWCPDDWQFEQMWTWFYWNRRNPAVPYEDR